MEYKSDIEIARAAQKRPIQEIGAKLGIPAEDLVPYGHDKAKVNQDFIDRVQDRPNGKLILVTAINPTPAGEGKTTTTVGLGDGLSRIGKKAAICIREASLGPNFGMKGGAAGGGRRRSATGRGKTGRAASVDPRRHREPRGRLYRVERCSDSGMGSGPGRGGECARSRHTTRNNQQSPLGGLGDGSAGAQ